MALALTRRIGRTRTDGLRALVHRRLRRRADIGEAVFLSAELKPVLVDHFKRLAPMLDYLCAAVELEF